MDFQSEKSFGKLRLRALQPYHQILCMLKHVEDVEDRSNTPKGCNAMYVEDVEDGKRTYTHILAHNFLNTWWIFNPKKVLESWDWELCNHTIRFYVCWSMSKMSKIDQIHLRAVMLCMSKTSKMGKEHTHTFWLITSLILNGFSIRKKFWKAETESFPTIPSNSMYVEACRRCRR